MGVEHHDKHRLRHAHTEPERVTDDHATVVTASTVTNSDTVNANPNSNSNSNAAANSNTHRQPNASTRGAAQQPLHSDASSDRR